MGANTRIEPNEAFVFVPANMAISVIKAMESDIGIIFKTHSELFSDHFDAEYLTLTVFCMYEYNKGKEGFWWPYF